MGISRTILTGGISNTEALTGVVMPKDFIDAPKSVIQSLATPATMYPSTQPQAPIPQAEQPQTENTPSAATTSKAAATTQTTVQKRATLGTASLIGT